MEIMLDSGSSVSLIQQGVLSDATGVIRIEEASPLQLVTASGDRLPILDHVKAPVKLGELELMHKFVVVEKLVSPVILGVDFLHDNRLVLDFAKTPVTVRHANRKLTQKPKHDTVINEVLAVHREAAKLRAKACVVATVESPGSDTVEECAVPDFQKPTSFEFPECPSSDLMSVVEEHRELFRTTPGVTDAAHHFIPTAGTPVRVPPRRIPAHYREEVDKQITTMLAQGIIKESSSPWMAPAVFVLKKSGDLRLCIDYRELNKKTKKDAYPLPLPDEVQDRLAGSTIFSTLDLQSGYWQLPVSPTDREKTAFCPGPGMGLFEFCRMPFGLSGAPSSFQRLMDKVLRGLPFVTIYLDDILVHSESPGRHKQHLQMVFERLTAAGLTLRGKKCHIGLGEVSYLGHIFSGSGMAPDPQKVQAVTAWPVPTDVSAVRQFLGLASYYRRYIPRFADIASPLNVLTKKGNAFQWTAQCTEAFSSLKNHLVRAPILVYPQFGHDASQFVVQTDASAVGIGAVLEQDGHVVAYASRTLTTSERNYSVIQRECLAAVYALKQFRHYLLGRPFHLLTDHAPLQWLSAQKMEGMLCRWALALQEYDFNIVYRKGALNSNADALSRRSFEPCAVTLLTQHNSPSDISLAQQNDEILSTVWESRTQSDTPPTGNVWNRHPFRRYKQLWMQLEINEGVLCRRYTPEPTHDSVTVPILPTNLRHHALVRCHNIPSAGHQGSEKTLERLRMEAYWVGMAQDVERHCRECIVCQQSKLPSPPRVPLTNVPIGRPWQMVAVDILEVPLSTRNNRYLLVVQDYFTKWVEAIPLPDQTAVRITDELTKLFSTYGQPDILHSDQGRNFESTVLAQTLKAFGVQKSRTTAYHPQGDGMVERFNRSLLQLLRAYVDKQENWEKYLPLVLFAYRTAKHTSTGSSPFILMFGRTPSTPVFSPQTGFESTSYPDHIQNKLAELRDFVECNLAAAAHHQKTNYDKHTQARKFAVGDLVWLSIPTAGKLDPRWEGKWEIKSVKSNITMEITDGRRTKVVHVNRLHHRIQPTSVEQDNSETRPPAQEWQPPTIDHIFIAPPANVHSQRYPQRNRGPPERYGF